MNEYKEEIVLFVEMESEPVRITIAYNDDPVTALSALHQVGHPAYLSQVIDTIYDEEEA